jgi:DDB1- and CUL4-associated factor 13
VLSRSTSSIQAPGSNVVRAPRNLDPALHPFERAREYTRALNATKLDRVFAQPFVAQLGNGHVDGVYAIAKDPESLNHFASASADGVVKVWDLPSRKEIWQAQNHQNMIQGICWTREGKIISCGNDKKIQMSDPYNTQTGSPPTASWLSPTGLTGISMHRNLPSFAVSGGSSIYLYDIQRSGGNATETLSWPTGVDTIKNVSFNQTETSLLAASATDRAVLLFDLRTSSPIHRTVLTLQSNKIAWNPMEAFNFAVASEDHNVYIFDCRSEANLAIFVSEQLKADSLQT